MHTPTFALSTRRGTQTAQLHTSQRLILRSSTYAPPPISHYSRIQPYPQDRTRSRSRQTTGIPRLTPGSPIPSASRGRFFSIVVRKMGQYLAALSPNAPTRRCVFLVPTPSVRFSVTVEVTFRYMCLHTGVINAVHPVKHSKQ